MWRPWVYFIYLDLHPGLQFHFPYVIFWRIEIAIDLQPFCGMLLLQRAPYGLLIVLFFWTVVLPLLAVWMLRGWNLGHV